MKGFKLLSAGVLAVCALLLVAMPVSAASAKSVLQLDEGETAAPPEAFAYIAFDLASCGPENVGHLTGNDAATIKLVTTTIEDECGREGSSMTGEIKEAELTSKGKITLIGSVTIKEEKEGQTCSYTFSKFKNLAFTVPGPVEYNGSAAGKLTKTGNSKSCPKSATKTLSVTIAGTGAQPFNAVLVP